MITGKTIVMNKSGLHARPASDFTRAATQFKSDIKLINLNNHKEGDAKSIISVMTMLISQNTPIEITAEGEDEQAAVDTLIKLVENGFGEI